MDKQILFQGQREDTGEWIEGNYALNCHLPCTIEEEWYSTIQPLHDYSHRVFANTVGQFANKTDKNGRKVFTHSRIKHASPDGLHTVYGRIEFGDIPQDCGTNGNHVGFYIEWENDGENKWNEWWRHDLGFWLEQESTEVIGTIFDREVI